MLSYQTQTNRLQLLILRMQLPLQFSPPPIPHFPVPPPHHHPNSPLLLLTAQYSHYHTQEHYTIMFITLCQAFSLIVNAVLPLSAGFVSCDWGASRYRQERSPPLQIADLLALNTGETPASTVFPGCRLDPSIKRTETTNQIRV